MPFRTFVRRLMDQGLNLDAIKHMTPWQVRRLIDHPRDRDGRLRVIPPPGAIEAAESPEDMARNALAAAGLPGWLIARKWREHNARNREGTDNG